MNTPFFNTLLVIHIISGAIGFVVAPIALIVKKGSAAHKRWGKIFFAAMTGVATTAIIMAPMHHNQFLTFIAVFSYYLAFSGYRAVYRRRHSGGKPGWPDWTFVILDLAFSAFLFIFGLINLPNPFGIISMAFGLIGFRLGMKDLSIFRNPIKKHDWLFSHIIGMVAAYISAVSAFSAVNLNFPWIPAIVQWLWPTIIGLPFIFRYISKLKKKLAAGNKVLPEFFE